ncbi:MAG: DUF805 domain-containing protein [Elusimicrobia bacterium]|nr:DUF805 domain-containing protein [Elusimicrobiota bacterium]
MNLKKYCKFYFTDIIFKHYFDFQGREGRKVFWLFTLNMFVVSFLLSLISTGLSTVISLLVLLPSLGLTVRRLHDIDFNGWWILIGFIPFIGSIVLIIFACLPGTEGENRFGPAPTSTVMTE